MRSTRRRKRLGHRSWIPFKKNTVTHEAQDEITGTWDIVVVGAGGAGMMAAAQAAQNGDTVLVLEKNAEMGGNTLVSAALTSRPFDAVVWGSCESGCDDRGIQWGNL